ncbi:MAG: adenylate/guanylate cyclase domain-containing response regulator [Desulfobacteraceae bacterium]|nr:MAG: adenylate/guanylate cyclase domain-containing response regulator [Desulfobacteraceae bacterium]
MFKRNVKRVQARGVMEKRVLIVDDDEKLRNLVKEYLEEYGFSVHAVADGRSLMETLREQEPEVVLLDLMLPFRDGLELLREVRAAGDTPVIMLTAKGEDSDRIVGLEMGADDYIPKPFNPRELLARIKAVMRRRPQPSYMADQGRRGLPETELNRKLKAILSADAKGFSRLMGDDELATIQVLNDYRGLLSECVKEHGGSVVDSPGDNLLAEFDSVVVAVRCAVKIQETLNSRNAALPDLRKMHFRIGINLGDVVVDQQRIYGDGVNVAARIEKIADPGGICISGTVFDQIENKVPFAFEFMGERELKNIAKPVRVYRLKQPF